MTGTCVLFSLQNDVTVYRVTVVPPAEGQTVHVPQSLQNMIDAFNSLNETVKSLVAEGTQLAEQVGDIIKAIFIENKQRSLKQMFQPPKDHQ